MTREKFSQREEAGAQEWDSIAALWQQQPAAELVPDAIMTRVRRQDRWLRMGLVLEWIVAASLCGFVLIALIQKPDTTRILIALLVCALVVWALVFSVGNRKGLWRPLEETTSAYLALIELRVERQLRAIRFAWLLYMVEMLIFLTWELFAYLEWLEQGLGLFSVRAGLTIVLVTGALVLWSAVVFWRCRKETLTISELLKRDSK